MGNFKEWMSPGNKKEKGNSQFLVINGKSKAESLRLITDRCHTRKLLFTLLFFSAVFLWLCSTAAVSHAAQRDALIDLYNSTNGPNWTNKTNWLGAVGTECTWYGVYCDSGNHVLTLDLEDNNLSGTIPASVGSLTSLYQLNLSSNYLTGSIPAELGSITNLIWFNLGWNQLTGSIPASLGNRTGLQALDLSGNLLNGSIPTQLNNLTNLQWLLLGGNQLTGSIPALANITNLYWLDLSNNQLTGTISLGNFSYLEYLDLSNNQLTGTIPTSLSNLTNLINFYLSSNKLTGTIPTTLGNLTKLNSFYLNGNQLTGSIPTQLTNLIHLGAGDGLDIRYNALYTSDSALRTFLNSKQNGGNWENTQTIAPTGLSAGSPTLSSLTLTWTPIVYTTDTGGYRVLYSTTTGGPYTLFGTTSTKSISSMIVTGLNPSTTYFFVFQTETDPHAANQNTVMSENSTEISAVTSSAYTVTPSSGGNGTISPNTPQVVTSGTQTFTLSPNNGYHIGTIGGTCPAGTLSGNNYTTGAITADCTVIANFAINTYAVSFSFTGSGAMTCTPTTVSWGGGFACTISPGSGYHLESLLDNSVNVTALVSGASYSAANVTADHPLFATFRADAPVLRISGGGNTWHPLIQSAYNVAAASGDVIKTLASHVFSEDLNFVSDVAITIKGGVSEDFLTVTGLTTVYGTMTISKGTVIVENLILTSALVVTQVTPESTPTNNQNPSYTFNSTKAGTIVYGGSCSSAITTAVAGNNTIVLTASGGGPLAEVTYSNCTITVTDAAGHSQQLAINAFTIDITPPTLSEVVAVPILTNQQNPPYTFSSAEAGLITYGGSCSSATTTAGPGNNTIVLRASSGGGPLPDGTYSNCTITVTDAAGNPRQLPINTFTVDITPPTLLQVTAVPTPTTNHNPSYTFSSTETGAITYGGSCGSATTTAVAGNNTILLTASGGGTLPEGTYSNCTITVTDAAGNPSLSLSISPFIINGYTISFSFTGSGAMTCTPTTVSPGGSFGCTVSPQSGWHLDSLLDNSVNVTAQVSGTSYSVANVTADHTLLAAFIQNSTVLRISGGTNETWYTVLQSAYNAASSGDEILTLASDFYENPLTFDHNVSITLQGGWNTDFSGASGFTTIYGTMIISSGTVNIEYVIIR